MEEESKCLIEITSITNLEITLQIGIDVITIIALSTMEIGSTERIGSLSLEKAFSVLRDTEIKISDLKI